MENLEINLPNISHEEMDRLAVEWLKHRAEVEGPVAAVVLPQEAWNTLYETLQKDVDSSMFDLNLRANIEQALGQIHEFISDVGDVGE